MNELEEILIENNNLAELLNEPPIVNRDADLADLIEATDLESLVEEENNYISDFR